MKITLLVGETGAGKSSLIKAILKSRGFAEAESIGIGHHGLSCTQSPHLFEAGEPLGYLVDTRGTNDSDAKISDVDLLNSTMRELYNRSNKGPIEAHVIWVCNLTKRATASYQTQARFIQSLFSGYGGRSGWGSVMVVVQKGSTSAHRDAPVTAAAMCGCRDDALANRVVMADVLGWGDPEDVEEVEQAEILRTLPLESRKKLFKLEEEEFVEGVMGVLSRMPSCVIKFRNKRCAKCGQTGDDRFFVPLCHPREHRVHSQANPSKHAHRWEGNRWVPRIEQEFHHSNVLEKRHPKIDARHGSSKRHLGQLEHPSVTKGHCSGRIHGRIVWEHEEKGVYYHPQELKQEERKHQESKVTKQRIHPGSFSRWTGNFGKAFLLGVATLGASAVANMASGGEILGSWSCCGDGSSTKPGCIETSNVTYQDKIEYGRWYYPCCDKSENMPGCLTRYPCCDKDTSEGVEVVGCKGICVTCNQNAECSSGCMCDGCGNRTGSGFCTSVCNECLADLSRTTTPGCKYAECGCLRDTKGCRIDCCAEPDSPGCIRTCNACGLDASGPPCETVCTNCNKHVSEQGCIVENFCEGCARPWNDVAFCTFSCCHQDRTHEGCKGLCGGCGGPLPSEGCCQLQAAVQHKIVDF